MKWIGGQVGGQMRGTMGTGEGGKGDKGAVPCL